MKIETVLSFVRDTVKNTAVGVVKALTKNIYTVKLDQKTIMDVRIKEPVTLGIKGEVKVTNQKEVVDAVNSLSKAVTQFTTINTVKGYAKEGQSNNLNNVSVAINNLIGVLKNQKNSPITINQKELASTDPKKYVPVRLTDGKEFYKAIEDFQVSMKRFQMFADANGKESTALVDAQRHLHVDVETMPPISVEPAAGAALEALQDPLAIYKICDKDDDSEPNFFGFATIDGKWYILKEENNTYRYAFGDSEYVAAWTGKADLDYDYLFA